MARSRNSRLSKYQERKALHKIVLSLIGIVVIVFLLVKVAIPLLINFSLFLANFRSGSSDASATSSNSPNYLMPPILTPTFTATNSAIISLSGNAQANQQVILFINNNSADTVSTKEDGSFNFSNVTLAPGDNTLKVKAKSDKKVSDFSQAITITFRNNMPLLTLDTPHDNDTVKQQNIQVAGKTDADDKVTVNGFWAIVDSNGQYTYTLSLQNGDNQIKIISQDNAGNQTEKDLKVTYSP